MPNWCIGAIQVKGTKENRRKFVDLFLSNDSKVNESKKRYFARSWILDTEEEIEKELRKDVSSFSIEVAWSVMSCMIEGYPQEYENCPTIYEVTKELELEVQIATEECGLCFREFYHIKNGILIKDDCEDFPEEEYDADELYKKYSGETTMPKDYDTWLVEDYTYIRDEWYSDVYNKLTLAL